MTKAYRFAVVRRSIIEETFFVEADSEEEALDLANDGQYDDSNIETEWVDWYDEEFHSSDREPEPICQLYRMIKEHECGTTS